MNKHLYKLIRVFKYVQWLPLILKQNRTVRSWACFKATQVSKYIVHFILTRYFYAIQQMVKWTHFSSRKCYKLSWEVKILKNLFRDWISNGLKIESSPLQRRFETCCTIFFLSIYWILLRFLQFSLYISNKMAKEKSYVKFSEIVVKGRLQFSNLSEIQSRRRSLNIYTMTICRILEKKSVAT